MNTNTLTAKTIDCTWVEDAKRVNLAELSALYKMVSMGEKSPQSLAIALSNSMFVCFVYAGDMLIGAGRVLGDGVDTAYLADIAVHPDYQGLGLGDRIVRHLLERSSGHRKVILFAKPGTEPFYRRYGFLRLPTAMALFDDPEAALRKGLLTPEP
ncbi:MULTISPECIES: GNAT family N-acetyltransferase [Kitasatospora]|uniref:GNAT family N-acetyltransferase n=1 Tax=Kitasatospora TaxID=2063 RepID=UPI000C713A6D|nr:GNAT family N-acetyltransferase [Kitasatospora sp. GP30]MDH6139713.1 ribosomal protein S18 acetylase RimI-like enzyme [Kitasatospora sp. GP30]